MVMRLLDLFSGIGGFSYAAEKLVGGYETVAFCEQDKFCQQVLRKHWKDVPIYDDVRTIDAARLGRIDIVAGGFPCQAVSQAGLQKATEDDRWLWDEMLRIIKDCKPKWVIGENVVGLININEGVLFEQVQTDLENEGYSVQSVVIPAASKNAPHRRDRVWIIAHSNISSQPNESEYFAKRQGEWGSVADSKSIIKNGIRRETNEVADRGNTWLELERRSDRQLIEKTKKNVANTNNKRLQGQRQKPSRTSTEQRDTSNPCWRQIKSRLGYMADGLSEALSGHFSEEPKDIPRVAQNQKDRTKKLMALGNSIVPQVAAELFYAIKITEYGE